MAELHIEKKESGSKLWMVLALLALVVIAWWLFSRRDPAVGAAGGDVAPATVGAPAAQPVVPADTLTGTPATGGTGTPAATSPTPGTPGTGAGAPVRPGTGAPGTGTTRTPANPGTPSRL